MEETGTAEAKDAAIQVRDYALALDEIIPRARSEKHCIFTVDLVKELHKKIMAGDSDYKDVPGELRKSGRLVRWRAYRIFNVQSRAA